MNYLYASNYFMCRDYYPAHIFSVLKEQRADDPTHTATVKPFKIFANEIYKNVPGRGVFHRQGFFP